MFCIPIPPRHVPDVALQGQCSAVPRRCQAFFALAPAPGFFNVEGCGHARQRSSSLRSRPALCVPVQTDVLRSAVAISLFRNPRMANPARTLRRFARSVLSLRVEGYEPSRGSARERVRKHEDRHSRRGGRPPRKSDWERASFAMTVYGCRAGQLSPRVARLAPAVAPHYELLEGTASEKLEESKGPNRD